jgi:hypothetical protein
MLFSKKRLRLGVLSYFLNAILHITQSSKALEMSRLRADITYNRRLYSNSPTITITSDELSSITMPNENTWSSNTESQYNNSDADAGELNDTTSVEEEDYEANNEVMNEDSGDEEIGFSESDFNEYLQGWAEMLEEERQGTFEEGNELYEDEITSVTLDHISHPAVDGNAKWELKMLFKENLSLPI